MMKNGRLTTLSVLLGVCFVIFLSDGFSGVVDGWKDAEYEINNKSEVELRQVEVELKPVVGNIFPDTLQLVSDRKVPYQLSSLRMKLEDPGFYKIVTSAAALVITPIIILLLIWGGISFVRFIRDVQRQRIFIAQNVRRLRVISWFLFLITILQNLTSALDYYLLLVQSGVKVPGYSIVDFHFEYEVFFIALFFALFAEIFALGVRIKEEQDLTV